MQGGPGPQRAGGARSWRSPGPQMPCQRQTSRCFRRPAEGPSVGWTAEAMCAAVRRNASCTAGACRPEVLTRKFIKHLASTAQAVAAKHTLTMSINALTAESTALTAAWLCAACAGAATANDARGTSATPARVNCHHAQPGLRVRCRNLSAVSEDDARPRPAQRCTEQPPDRICLEHAMLAGRR